MKTWDSFYPFVLIEAPGAAYPLINQKLCLAAREFCLRTAAWTAWTDPIQATVTTGEVFDFDIESGAELVKVVRATIGTHPDVLEIPVLTDDREPSMWHQNPHKQCVVHEQGNDEFKLFVRQLGNPVNLLLAFKPMLTATGCGDVLVDRYADKIALGAKALLQMTPGYTFTNPGLAAENKALFEQAIHEVANETFRRRTNKRTAKVPIS